MAAILSRPQCVNYTSGYCLQFIWKPCGTKFSEVSRTSLNPSSFIWQQAWHVGRGSDGEGLYYGFKWSDRIMVYIEQCYHDDTDLYISYVSFISHVSIRGSFHAISICCKSVYPFHSYNEYVGVLSGVYNIHYVQLRPLVCYISKGMQETYQWWHCGLSWMAMENSCQGEGNVLTSILIHCLFIQFSLCVTADSELTILRLWFRIE